MADQHPPFFVLNDNIITTFLNGASEITCYEEHDIQELERKRDTPQTAESDRELLTVTIKRANELNQVSDRGRIVDTVYRKTESRYAPQASMFGLSKELKNEVYVKYGGYQSLDIVNRNYSIINEIAKQNNVHFEAIDKFVTNYQTYFQEYQVYWGGKEFVKKGFAELMSHPIHKTTETSFIKQLVDELQVVHSRLRHPQLPNYTVMHVIEIYSTFIINCAYHYLVDNGVIAERHCVFGNNVIFFKPLKDFDKKEAIPHIEKRIFEQTNMRISLH